MRKKENDGKKERKFESEQNKARAGKDKKEELEEERKENSMIRNKTKKHGAKAGKIYMRKKDNFMS